MADTAGSTVRSDLRFDVPLYTVTEAGHAIDVLFLLFRLCHGEVVCPCDHR